MSCTKENSFVYSYGDTVIKGFRLNDVNGPISWDMVSNAELDVENTNGDPFTVSHNTLGSDTLYIDPDDEFRLCFKPDLLPVGFYKFDLKITIGDVVKHSKKYFIQITKPSTT